MRNTISRTIQFDQELIVALLTVALFAIFAMFLPRFATMGNALHLVRDVSVLGIFGVAMAITVIGRGIDLSVVASAIIGSAWALTLGQQGHSMLYALGSGLVFVLVVGLINGLLIAYALISALFTTLAMWFVVYGFGMFFLLSQEIVSAPSKWTLLRNLGVGTLFGIPAPAAVFGFVLILAGCFLRFTNLGFYIKALGDNPDTSRVTGLPVRPVICLQYVVSAVLGYVAALVVAGSVNNINTRIVNSSMIYDVILVVVLGGIGLSGGKGSVRNVIIGTLFIGVLINGMTIMNLGYTVQNLVKSVILLIAILIDAALNPRDEQTAQQGDI